MLVEYKTKRIFCIFFILDEESDAGSISESESEDESVKGDKKQESEVNSLVVIVLYYQLVPERNVSFSSTLLNYQLVPERNVSFSSTLLKYYVRT
jgi:hypothetical protein